MMIPAICWLWSKLMGFYSDSPLCLQLFKFVSVLQMRNWGLKKLCDLANASLYVEEPAFDSRKICPYSLYF